MELFVKMEVILYWQSSSNLDDGGIVELPLYASSVSMIKLESWRRTKSKRTQAFHILVPSISLYISFCFVCSETVVLWWIHLYSGVSTNCYLNQYPYFGNIQITCKSVQSPGIFHFETWNFFSHQFWLRKLFPSTKVEVNKPDLRRIYLPMAPD